MAIVFDLGVVVLSREGSPPDEGDPWDALERMGEAPADAWQRLERALPLSIRLVEGARPPTEEAAGTEGMQPAFFARHQDASAAGWVVHVVGLSSAWLGRAEALAAGRAVLVEVLAQGWARFGYFTTVLDQLQERWIAPALLAPGSVDVSPHYSLVAVPAREPATAAPTRGFVSVHDDTYGTVWQRGDGGAGIVERRFRAAPFARSVDRVALARFGDDVTVLEYDLPTGTRRTLARADVPEDALHVGRWTEADGVEHGVYASRDGPVFFAGERRFLLATGAYDAVVEPAGPFASRFSLRCAGEVVYEVSYRPDDGADMLARTAPVIGTDDFNAAHTVAAPAADEPLPAPEPPPAPVDRSTPTVEEREPIYLHKDGKTTRIEHGSPGWQDLDYDYDDYTGG